MKREYKQAIQNKTILITGGTGSFGHYVVGTLLSCKPKRIIIFSRDEKKQFDMRNEFDNPILTFVIGDVRDKESLHRVMAGVDYVFHAAALKQVPNCEFYPIEAVKTNVLGAYNVVSSAIEHKVHKVVALSTDKAVYPINAMGMSKALMEKIFIAESKNLLEQGKTIFCTVRYGNVLYTRGSVLPYFVEQMRKNKKLPVTNPDMTRYLLPLADAVDLVLYTLVHGENGCTYVRKSSACTMETMAKAVCEIFKYKKGYEIVGIRAGEKLHETLVAQEELIRGSEHGHYFKIRSETQGLDYNKYLFHWKKTDLAEIEAFTSANTKILNVKQTKKLLLSLPEIQTELQRIRV